MANNIPIDFVEPDDNSFFDDKNMLMVVEIQAGVMAGVDHTFDRLIQIYGNSTLDSDDWMDKEDFQKFALCVGLGFKDMKLSGIINQAIVKGCIEIAKFNEQIEKELKIT